MKKVKILLSIVTIVALSSCITSKNTVVLSDPDHPHSIYEKVYH
ncbi:hypothetical protein [Flammeovirga yaeyamensis]|nr:hypothetical protein [Flammeovirga yaeyamensis]MBB3698134.1 hypothetical protein [Flammeovirga yaeyamensis]